MLIPIHIRNINIYGMIVLATLSLGSFTIARHIHIRWLSQKMSFIASNALVKTVIMIFGLLIIPIDTIFLFDIYHEISGLLIGLVLGVVTVLTEVSMIRNVNRKNLIRKNIKTKVDDSNFLRNSVVVKKMSLTSNKTLSAKGLTHVRQGYSQYAGDPDLVNYSIIAVIIVAIAEEFLFRGYMVSIARLSPSKFITIGIITCSIILFAASHIYSSWNDFKFKLPLSIFTTVGFIVSGTLLSAIATHLILNIYAYRQLKKMNYKKTIYNYSPIGMCSW